MTAVTPPQPAAPLQAVEAPIECPLCYGLTWVVRIRGGASFEQLCPDCTEEDPEWNVWLELWDDARMGR